MNKKPTKKRGRRRCSICHEWYMPDPRTGGHQTCCQKPSCQSERKRRANKSWRIRHPDYDQTRNAKKRDWAQAYPDYWQQYRRNRPEYQVREKQRMQLVREQAKNVANQDAIAKISVEQLQSIPRWEPQNVANQDVMDRRVDQVIDWLLHWGRVARQNSISARPRGMP